MKLTTFNILENSRLTEIGRIIEANDQGESHTISRLVKKCQHTGKTERFYQYVDISQ